MTTKKTTRSFTISATLGLETSIEISAESLEDAVEKSKVFNITDFVDIKGEHNDSTFQVTGAYCFVPLNR